MTTPTLLSAQSQSHQHHQCLMRATVATPAGLRSCRPCAIRARATRARRSQWCAAARATCPMPQCSQAHAHAHTRGAPTRPPFRLYCQPDRRGRSCRRRRSAPRRRSAHVERAGASGARARPASSRALPPVRGAARDTPAGHQRQDLAICTGGDERRTCSSTYTMKEALEAFLGKKGVVVTNDCLPYNVHVLGPKAQLCNYKCALTSPRAFSTRTARVAAGLARYFLCPSSLPCLTHQCPPPGART